MVSLRTNLGGLRLSAASAAGALLMLGIGLTALAVGSLALHGSSLADSAADPNLKNYLADLREGTSFDLNHANRTIHLATTHSDDRRIAITENWIQWTLGNIYEPLSRTQNAERLMGGSIANCSERSQILKWMAEGAGYQCRFVGLSGHVVLEVETSRGWQVADPDYGIVYPFGIKALEQPAAEPLIRDMLAAAGYPPANIELYVAIVQSTDDNVTLPIGSPLSPRLAAVERWCERLALPLPLGLILAGLIAIGAKNHVRIARQ